MTNAMCPPLAAGGVLGGATGMTNATAAVVAPPAGAVAVGIAGRAFVGRAFVGGVAAAAATVGAVFGRGGKVGETGMRVPGWGTGTGCNSPVGDPAHA